MRNLLGRQYIVKRYGTDHRWTFDKSEAHAIKFALLTQRTTGGDWTVTRVSRSGHTKVVWHSVRS